VTLVLPLAFLLTLTTRPALATPDEGGSKSLYEQLDEANTAWHEAKTALETSRTRQSELSNRITELEHSAASLSGEVAAAASEAYASGPMEFAIALDENDFDTLVDKMSFISQLTWQNDSQVRELTRARDELTQQRSAVDNEISQQEVSEREMAQRTQEAQNALEAVEGHPSLGYIASGAPAAAPAPRGADGGFDAESCTESDPTGGPCLTPRTAHAYSEARRVGFTHYSSCNHAASWGEHPKGRACDMAADPNNFGGTAAGDSKSYGNRLAAWFVENAEALGVMYVIWFKQCWMPSTGWSSYDGGSDPSSAHTNHVHVSML
jgi:hypothetical protein